MATDVQDATEKVDVLNLMAEANTGNLTGTRGEFQGLFLTKVYIK